MSSTKEGIVSRLYGNEVELFFYPEKHLYMEGGSAIDGVTTILGTAIAKPALVPWAVKMASEYVAANLKPGQALDEFQLADLLAGIKTAHRKKSTGAADIGHFVHEWISDFIQGKEPEPPVNAEAKKCIAAFFEWVHLRDVQFVSTERVVYSRAHRYAGTFDALCRIDGALTLIDFKTGSGCYWEMGLQLSAYALAYEEEHPGDEIKRRFIVNIRKDGVLEEREYKERQSDDDAFLAAITIHRASKTWVK